jgi:glycosyltransferase involved in cell wall biosynthesis
VLEGFEDILRERDDIQLILELNPDCCYLGGFTPEDLLNKLISLGYDSYLLNDQEHRLYRPADGGANSWKSILGENSHINLLCKKRSVSTNVLIFSHSSFLAGGERSLLELVKELTEDYGTLCTVALPSHGPLEIKLQDVGAATIIAPLNWWCSSETISNVDDIHQRYVQSFQWLYENLRQFELINPDVILTNTIVIPWGALVAHLLKRPHIWMIREFGEVDQGFKFFFPFSKIVQFTVESSDVVVTNSNAVREQLYPNHEKDIVKTIYSYIDTNNENTSESSKTHSFALPNASHLAILGTVAKLKGQEDAIKAVIELNKNRNRRAELIVAGYCAQPDFKNHLQEIIDVENANNYIHIIPFQENVLPIFQASDIILVCSKIEAFGRVTLEAMQRKKAVIATNTGGTPEMIHDGKTGLLYTPGNHLQLADQIEKLLDNPEMRLKLAHNAHKFAITTFTKNKFGGEYNKIILGLKSKKYEDKDKISWFISIQHELLIQTLNMQLVERKQTIQSLTARVAEREQAIQVLNNQAKEHVQKLETSKTQMEIRDQLIKTMSSQVLERNQAIKTLNAQIAERDQSLQSLNYENVMYAMSKSWGVTRPLRKFVKMLKGKRNA